MKYKLRCISCGSEQAFSQGALTCPSCGPHKGTLDVIYPLGELKKRNRSDFLNNKERSVFNSFQPIFPFENLHSLPPLIVGNTPFFKAPNLSRLTGFGNLWIKDDGRNPSASFKDRASAVALAMARESGESLIAVASTGNAASSLATLAAAIGMSAVLFVPKNAPRPKLAQIMIHGGHIIRLDCDYDTAFDLCQIACDRFGWYNRNTAVNPFTSEGKKSAALEIARDLGKAPDAVICSVGDGCIIGGLHKGFSDLLGLEIIDQIPRLYGIQAENACPVVKAFDNNGDIVPFQVAKTVADSISVGYPRDGYKALRATKSTGGAMLAVSDYEILSAQKLLASRAGVFSEPAAAAAMAGLLRLKAKFGKNENIVLLLTGHGLKDIDTALNNSADDDEVIAPDIDSISKKIDRIFKTNKGVTDAN
jgi:threonine synthase